MHGILWITGDKHEKGIWCIGSRPHFSRTDLISDVAQTQVINTTCPELVVSMHIYTFSLNWICESLQGKWLHLVVAVSVLERGSNHRSYITTDQALCGEYRIYAEEDLDETWAMCNKTRMNLDRLSWMGFVVVFVWPRHADLLFFIGIGKRFCCWS